MIIAAVVAQKITPHGSLSALGCSPVMWLASEDRDSLLAQAACNDLAARPLTRSWFPHASDRWPTPTDEKRRLSNRGAVGLLLSDQQTIVRRTSFVCQIGACLTDCWLSG